jgi:thioredoxin reductase (NADPH)
MNPQTEVIRKDVVIIGAGPAGLSALLWCADLGLDAAIVEQRPEPGGQLLSIHNPITNYLGLTTQNGREMSNRFLDQAAGLLTNQYIDIAASAIDVENKVVRLSDGRAIKVAAIILATGVRRRRLGIEGETEFEGRGVLESGAKEKASLKDKRVVIVGGGDAALENALIIGEYASEIIVIHRRGTFSARPEFVAAAVRHPKVRIVYDARPVRIIGSGHVEAIEFVHIPGGEPETIPTDAVLIRIGVEPNSDLIREQVSTDDRGYILTGTQCETSVPGIFAVGDVANPTAPTISAAAGSAATAAKAIYTQIRALK